MLVRDVAFEVLRRQGITTVFGNPGSNELPFLAGMPEGFRYVLGLREGAVLGMADGYAQVTRQPVLVNLHAASGTGNAMGALTNAVYARTPLVLVAGQQVRPSIGMEAMLSNVEATQLAKPLAAWAGEPACAADVPRPLAQASSRRGCGGARPTCRSRTTIGQPRPTPTHWPRQAAPWNGPPIQDRRSPGSWMRCVRRSDQPWSSAGTSTPTACSTRQPRSPSG